MNTLGMGAGDVVQGHETCYDRVFLREGGYERCRGSDPAVRVW